jgi:hypothetical protein
LRRASTFTERATAHFFIVEHHPPPGPAGRLSYKWTKAASHQAGIHQQGTGASVSTSIMQNDHVGTVVQQAPAAAGAGRWVMLHSVNSGAVDGEDSHYD